MSINKSNFSKIIIFSILIFGSIITIFFIKKTITTPKTNLETTPKIESKTEEQPKKSTITQQIYNEKLNYLNDQTITKPIHFNQHDEKTLANLKKIKNEHLYQKQKIISKNDAKEDDTIEEIQKQRLLIAGAENKLSTETSQYLKDYYQTEITKSKQIISNCENWIQNVKARSIEVDNKRLDINTNSQIDQELSIHKEHYNIES